MHLCPWAKGFPKGKPDKWENLIVTVSGIAHGFSMETRSVYVFTPDKNKLNRGAPRGSGARAR